MIRGTVHAKSAMAEMKRLHSARLLGLDEGFLAA
jgi:hypothetical protein